MKLVVHEHVHMMLQRKAGDSEMRHFAPYCHQVDECSTLKQLERVVSGLLRSG